MKLVKNFVFAVLLASILAVNAPAGELGTPAAAGPTPAPTPNTASSTQDGKTASYSDPDATVISADTSDYLFYEALAALLSVF